MRVRKPCIIARKNAENDQEHKYRILGVEKSIGTEINIQLHAVAYPDPEFLEGVTQQRDNQRILYKKSEYSFLLFLQEH